MQVVILAGGLGTRMRAYAPEIPKCLIPVAGRPFAELQLSWLSAQGASQVLYSIGYLGDQIRSFIGDGSRWNLQVRYVDEGLDLRGTAGALRLALDLDLLEDRFLVLYGDSYLTVDLSQVDTAHRQGRFPALMTVFRNDGRWEESNAAFDGARVTRYEKHAADPSPDMRFVDYGLSALSTRLIEQQIPPDTASDLAALFGELSLQGRLGGFEVHQRFYEIGSPEGLRDLELLLSPPG
ncbi:MAG TPA: sugar phosphate nucleotidyltransferase [Acidimicrobiales bacterium]|nr:sugar phosphate nucleotidyltransferase [Acidimicrobiales bacterium]